MTAKIILNPYAGRWNGRRRRLEIEETLKSMEIPFDLVATKGPNHAIELAYQAASEGYSPIIAAGGDGTFSEVMNGIVTAAQDAYTDPIPLGLLPIGTANDLMVNLGIPINLLEAARVISLGKTRSIDLGKVTAWDSSGNLKITRYFDNNSAIGLEPNVTLTQQKIKWLRGSVRYLVATLLTILKNPQWNMHLEWDSGRYDGPATLVTVGNNPVTGGVFYMAPHADPYDGKFNCVYGSVKSRREILRILPKTMKPGAGNYVEDPAIHEINVSWLKIHTDNPTPLHADGEIQFAATQDIEYQILPNYLPVLIHGSTNE